MMGDLKKAISRLKMEEDKRVDIRNSLMDEYDAKPAHKKRRFAAAIALSVAVLGAVSVSAAILTGGFNSFFSNAEEESIKPVLQKLEEAATHEAVVSEGNGYRITAVSNLYSEEQGMGIAVCSLEIDGSCDELFAAINEDGPIYLKAGGEEYIQEEPSKPLEHRVSYFLSMEGEARTYYYGEKDDDSFLIGIRYEGKDALRNLKLVSAMGDRDMSVNIENVGIPAADNMPVKIFDKDELHVVLSPIGVYVSGSVDDMDVEDYDLYGFELEKGDSSEKLSDYYESNRTYTNGGIFNHFSKLMDIDEITSVKCNIKGESIILE